MVDLTCKIPTQSLDHMDASIKTFLALSFFKKAVSSCIFEWIDVMFRFCKRSMQHLSFYPSLTNYHILKL